MRTYNLEKYKSIQPSRVIEVLEKLGWQEYQSMPGVVSIWENNHEQQEWKILLPLDPGSPDYPNKMIEVIKVVSHFEDKDEHEILEGIIDSSFTAKEKNRDVVTLKLTSEDCSKNNISEFPAKFLGFILTSLQNLIDSIGKVEAGYLSVDDYIPQSVIDKTRLTIFGTAPGSFIVKFASPDRGQLNLLEESLTEKALGSFLELIELSEKGERSKLKELLIRLNKKSLKTYKKFLERVADSESDIFVEWGPPDSGPVRSAKLNSMQVVGLIDFLSKVEPEAPEIVIVEATLVGGDTKSLSFKIKPINSSEKLYTGKIASDVLKKGIDLTLGNSYSFVLEETELIDSITGESTLQHKMIDVNVIGGS